MADPPILHVIAGPNGAGKSSLYDATICRITDAEFVNADRLVFETVGEHASTEAQAKLGQDLANARRDVLMSQRSSFVTESTFSHPSKVELVREAQKLGYVVVIYHVNLDSADLAVARVGQRQANGGHPVPEDRIRGRYLRNPDLIREALLSADAGMVFDNSTLGQPPRRVLTFEAGKILVGDPSIPPWTEEIYAVELAEWRRGSA